jgi:hypothetical protein
MASGIPVDILAMRTRSNRRFGRTLLTATHWWSPFIDTVRYSRCGSAHRILAFLTVFDDRPSIPIFVYLFGDGFLTSSGDMALLPLYVWPSYAHRQIT